MVRRVEETRVSQGVGEGVRVGGGGFSREIERSGEEG
jgi:hypothetical protein